MSASGEPPGEPEPSGETEPAEPVEPSPLELKYRRVLRALPRPYRSVREEEMVATFLDSARDADPDNADLTIKFGSVGIAETLSVIALALRLRWADPHAPRRYQVKAAGLRIFTLACLTVLAASAVQLLLGSFIYVLVPPPEVATESVIDLLFPSTIWWWEMVRRWAYLLWVPALILAVRGTRRAVRAAAACTTIPVAVSLGGLVMASFGAVNTVLSWADWLPVIVEVAVLAGLPTLAAAPRSSTARRRHLWLLASVVLMAAYDLMLFILWLVIPPSSLAWPPIASVVITGTDGGLWSFATLAAALVLAVRRLSGRRTGAAVLLGLAGLAVATGLRRLRMLPLWIGYAHQDVAGSTQMLSSAIIGLGLITAIAIGAAIAAVARIRRMPTPSYQPDNTAAP